MPPTCSPGDALRAAPLWPIALAPLHAPLHLRVPLYTCPRSLQGLHSSIKHRTTEQTYPNGTRTAQIRAHTAPFNRYTNQSPPSSPQHKHSRAKHFHRSQYTLHNSDRTGQQFMKDRTTEQQFIKDRTTEQTTVHRYSRSRTTRTRNACVIRVTDRPSHQILVWSACGKGCNAFHVFATTSLALRPFGSCVVVKCLHAFPVPAQRL